MHTVHVVGCGGTIASEPAEDGAAPAKAGDELVRSVPDISEYADLRVTDVGSRPGFDMDFGVVAAAAEEVRTAVADGADGVVVTHGTDTLADTAYALDIACNVPVPVIVTGSQRRFDEPGSDAPSNLLTAVRAAVDGQFAPGVHIAFDDELHAARDAVKTHTNALDTFQSPGKGPVATFTRETTRLHRDPEQATSDVSLPAAALDADRDTAAYAVVPAVHSGTGVDGASLERFLPDADGIVVEGTGLGNATGSLGDAVADALESVPVVVSSRCHAGPTEAVYGTAGGGVTLRDHGVAYAGTLSTAKARVKLVLGLTAGLSREAVEATFE
ncbi:l-asparaginase/glutrnagln amidotransferase subunit d [Halogeometricum borinquense DSM 11551]|uniref:L-asparaginase/GlutRNAGln amidotransferase subunit D n=1 Tax=Halogeometricum borinquense (strain ATCC 700274 / DSM 11551 / JCM 10706 / KCTC 4070 / PR3) TaxID=469382 RepID=E4NPC4_HALBP|nr:asparaginase [Halogeometricum borinquense]ADQ66479.1 L-asparaginase/GlutRNAGln amidotransferase subunit D [Halogeometricum borinquense DSM 11551]ELY31198.1 l-asparaginase/glutrnagln amidotransferase subunit d [Halogeometricum borinquense DSM 11551]